MANKTGSSRPRRRWYNDRVIPILIVVGAIALAVIMVTVSAVRPLSTLELVLWQVVSLALGLYGSYRFGQTGARNAAQDIVRTHARAAVRRILSLRDSLYRLSSRIEGFKSQGDDRRLDVIQAIVDEQIPNSRYAVDDWRDLAPKDVEEILKTAAEQRGVTADGNPDQTHPR